MRIHFPCRHQLNRNEKISTELQQPLYNLYDHGDQQAEQNHGGDWKIKPVVLFFNTNITGQSPDPLKFIPKKIPDHSPGKEYDAHYHDDLSG